jgi:hypothetical protein
MHTHRRAINLTLLSFSLSCSWFAQAEFEPIELAPGSYNQDLVVEKTAPLPAITVTTASMEQGDANSGYTWFERGYLPEWPATGLPEAGSLLTSDLLADHRYQMPFSYQTRNAVLLDSMRADALITFITPTNYAALSFLTSSGAGRNLIHYIVNYDDGSSEGGAFTSPNWYSDGDPAWAANGRVNVTTFTRADLNSYNPRLYSVDVAISEVLSPIKSIRLSYAGGSGHTAIFAVSGASSPGAAFVPIEITGYNEDLVVEANAVKPGSMETNTTATMESGSANIGFTWYERGYNPIAPESGLPTAGSLVTSDSDTGHHFLMPPTYAQPNAILIDSICSNSTLTSLRAACYSALSFLTASSSGPTTNQCVVKHSNGNSETNTFISPDWLGNSPSAVTTHGRVSVSTKLTDRLNSDAPRLYTVDVPISDTNNPVTHIRLSRIGRDVTSHTVIFAIAGAPTSPSNRPVLSISRDTAGQLTIRSTQAGRLESCVALCGAETSWEDEGPISEVLTLTPDPAEASRFYRVVPQ